MRHPTLVIGTLLAAALPATAADPPRHDPRAVEFFEKRVRPVLAEHCFACHSTDAEKKGKLKGGLLLDSRDGWAKGGDSGPAVVPGKPDESLLVKAVRYDDDEIHQILLHEVAHAMAGPRAGHGPKWVRIANDIGYVGRRTHDGEDADDLAPWVGRCPAGHEHYRYRAPVRPLSCGLCRRGFDPTNLIVWRRREITGAMRRAAAAAAADPARSRAASPGARSR